MKLAREFAIAAALFGGALLTPGCTLIGETPSARFYVLAPAVPETDEASSSVSIGVGPIALPRYVERPQIITRASRNRLEFYEYDRWAEPLDDAVPSVLTEDVARILGTDSVVTHPWRGSVDVDYQVTARIVRFDAEVDGPAVLVARWRIYDGSGRSVLVMRRSRFEATAATARGAQGVVEALNATIGAFAAEISETITSLSNASPSNASLNNTRD
jgi:uncharacterized lipoprotein YmbA